MNTHSKLAPYIAGGLFALLSEGLLGASLGVPTPLSIIAAPSTYSPSADLKVQQDFAQLGQVVPPNVDVSQQVDRTLSGQRGCCQAAEATFHGSSRDVTQLLA